VTKPLPPIVALPKEVSVAETVRAPAPDRVVDADGVWDVSAATELTPEIVADAVGNDADV
jgi:hypothetical protein